MRYPFLVVPIFLLAVLPSHAGAKPGSAQDTPPAKHVWSNEDLDALRERGLITTFEPYAQPVSFQPGPELPSAASVKPAASYSHTQDPSWYAEQADVLHDALAKKQAELDNFRANLDLAQSGEQTTGGMDMSRPNIGVTPADGEAVLESQVQEIQNQLDDLEDQARRNDIPPGVVRG